MGVTRLYLTQRARDQQQTMRVLRHLLETIDEDRTLGRARVN